MSLRKLREVVFSVPDLRSEVVHLLPHERYVHRRRAVWLSDLREDRFSVLVLVADRRDVPADLPEPRSLRLVLPDRSCHSSDPLWVDHEMPLHLLDFSSHPLEGSWHLSEVFHVLVHVCDESVLVRVRRADGGVLKDLSERRDLLDFRSQSVHLRLNFYES